MNKVLFLCTGNSCRSQMAEGWARHYHGDDMDIYSAGTAPHEIDPRAVQVMAEAGVDISLQTSNHVNEYQDIPFSLVVTVCDHAKESCPAFPGAKETLHWPFDDPADATGPDEAKMRTFVRVRDEIEYRISKYLQEAES